MAETSRPGESRGHAAGIVGRQDRLLEGTQQAFADACQAFGIENVREIALRFAGHPVRLRVAGSQLAGVLFRCFEPLVDPTGLEAPFALSIDAWDRLQTGVGCPGIPHAPDVTNLLGPGLMSQYNGGRVLRYERAEIVKCFDRVSSKLFISVDDARRLRLNDRTKPFPHFLATWYFDRGVHLLHAGAVARNGLSVLFAGAGGSGKSTSSIACAVSGFDIMGDDTIGTVIENDAPIAYLCYNSLRLDSRNLNWHPKLRSVSTSPDHPSDKNKSLVYISDVFSGNITYRSPVAAIVAPRIEGSGASRLVKATKAATLLRLAPSTLFRGLGAGATGFAHIAELTRRLPCYELVVGATSADIPDLISQLLDDLN